MFDKISLPFRLWPAGLAPSLVDAVKKANHFGGLKAEFTEDTPEHGSCPTPPANTMHHDAVPCSPSRNRSGNGPLDFRAFGVGLRWWATVDEIFQCLA
jgi:hypothetical protein